MLSVILPAYNESRNVSKTIRKSVDVLSQIGQDFEIVLVDDGSEDNTYQQAVEASKEYKNVRALGYHPNMGKGYALKYGSRFAQGDLVLFLDADLDIPASQIPQFLKYMQENRADVVIGSKRHPLSKVQYPLSRRFLSQCYSTLLKLMFNLDVADTQVGIKLFRREVLERVIPEVKINGFAFDIELLANTSKAKYKIVEAPVEIDFQFGSRVNLIQIWKMFSDTLNIFYRMKFMRHHHKSSIEAEVKPDSVSDHPTFVKENHLGAVPATPRTPVQTEIAPAVENNQSKSE
jgi:glycosyltransferase involved in cell wall biosynthesis